jgi:hypothetical protein
MVYARAPIAPVASAAWSSGVDTDVGEVVAEQRLHERPGGGVQRCPGDCTAARTGSGSFARVPRPTVAVLLGDCAWVLMGSSSGLGQALTWSEPSAW